MDACPKAPDHSEEVCVKGVTISYPVYASICHAICAGNDPRLVHAIASKECEFTRMDDGVVTMATASTSVPLVGNVPSITSVGVPPSQQKVTTSSGSVQQEAQLPEAQLNDGKTCS